MTNNRDVPRLVRLRCFEWSGEPKAIGDCYINLSAIASIGPEVGGIRLITDVGGGMWCVQGDEIMAAINIISWGQE